MLRAVGHHLADLDLLEVEDGAQHVVLLLLQPALLARDLDQAAQLVRRVGLVRDRLRDPDQPEDAAGGGVERPVERPADEVEGVQRPGDGQGGRLGLADGEGLRHLLAQHDVERGEQQEADRERDAVQGGGVEAREPEQGLQEGRDHRLADPAEAERGHRDAELAGGEVGLEAARDVQRQPCRPAAVLGQALEPHLARLHERELGRDEERVGREQDDDGEQGEEHRPLTARGRAEFGEERGGVPEVGGVEAFGEPGVDGGEEVDGALPLALPGPEAGERGGGAQLGEAGALGAGDLERAEVGGFGWSRAKRAACRP